ncbi:phage portal protein [Roseovarius aestuarii]|nr:phage portal protein [Roseovarius aestuarii]
MGIFRSGPVAEAQVVRSRDPSDNSWFEMRGPKTASGVEVTVERARRVPVVRDCLQVLAQSVGGLSFGVFEKRSDGQRDATDGHPIKALISDPNPRETSIEFLENLIDDLASEGRFLAERDWTSGSERLWRIEPRDFTVELLSDNSLRFRIREAGRPERVLLHEEVWYIPLPPVIGKVHGRSPILKDGAETIGAALALQRYANTFFANDATPPFIFKHKGSFADAASKDNFLNSWGKWFSGRNRHKPGMLEYDMDVHQLAHNNEQAQFLETRKELWLDVSRLWRMPPHKVGILDNATFSNIEHQSLEFVTDTLAPWLELVERSINKHLIADGRFYFEFNVASLLRGDIKTRYEAYALARNWGFLSVNEIRKLENRNGIGPAGDRYMEPLNMTGVGGAPGKSPAEKKEADQAIAFLRNSVAQNGGRPNLKVIQNVA